MTDEIIDFDLPESTPASIKVVGVGGGGGNAVNHMFSQGIKDVDFVLCNTDIQALQKSQVPIKIKLGESLTKGRGAGNKPEIGRESAIENIADVEKVLADNTQMVFITAGMGGGTGTGAAPIIAEAAKKLGILTVGIVTLPFRFEGNRRLQFAMDGIEAMKEHVDSLLVINNEKVREMYGNLTLTEAFSKADDVLAIAAKGIAEIITVTGMVNVDFADVQTVMTESGVAIMGSASASGEDRARKAIENALNSPLLNNADITGAKDILLNISSGDLEVTMDEISEITDFIIEEAGIDVNMIWGSVKDVSLGEQLNVTIIATGFEMENIPEFSSGKSKPKEKVILQEQKNRKEDDADFDDTRLQDNDDDDKKEFFTIDGSRDYSNPTQTELDFDVEDTTKFDKDKSITLINSQPSKSDIIRRGNEQESFEKHSEFDYREVRELDDITHLENEPAYKRRKMNLDFAQKKADGGEFSKYQLGEDKDGRPTLRESNNYMENKPD